MKTKQSCVSRRVEVRTRDKLRSEHFVAVVQELMKHLLYMRNQIPGLFEDLEWQIQASQANLARTHDVAFGACRLDGETISAAALLCAGIRARQALTS